MIDARSTFERLKKSHPEISAFEIPFSEAYDPTASPGKKADLANTIFECIGKLAWSLLPSAPKHEKIEKAMSTHALRKSRQFFEVKDIHFYDDLWEAVAKPAGRILGMRSEKGDISHGHLPTKEDLSAAHANLSLNLALSFAAYFFDLLEQASGRLEYDDHSGEGEFNEWLNEKGEKIGGAYFSWLLYQHDYDAYEAFYDEFVYETEKK